MKIKPKVTTKTTITGVTGEVSYARFNPVNRPTYTGKIRFPEDLTVLDSANVSDLHAKFTLMWSYVNQDYARFQTRILRLKQREARRVNEIFRNNPRLAHIEKWKRDAVISEDGEIESIRQEISNVEVESQYARMYLDNYDRYLVALSRELTRKMHELGLRTG